LLTADKPYVELERYLEYQESLQKIDHERMLLELASLEADTYNQFLTTADQRALHNIARHAASFHKMFHLEMTDHF